jgi:predicted Zn-dependent peptidase
LKFLRHTLDNGLEVVAECNPQAYSVALAYFVDTGARDEPPASAGVSHFLEHMMFKGTPTRTAADVNRELDEIGSQSNAYTSEEQTVYYATVLPEYQGRSIELLSDLMRPSLRDEDFETEKQVIIEEIHKYDDQPPYNAHEKCMAVFFGEHPLGQSVLGTVESVSQLTRDAMHDYFRRRYSPGNMKLIAAGNLDFDQLVADTDRYCGGWQPVEAGRSLRAAQPQHQSRFVTVEAATQQYLVQISEGPAADDARRYAQRLMSVILGDDSGSRLFWEFVDTGLAEYAATGTYEFDGAGILMTFLSFAPEDLDEIVSRLDQLQQRLLQELITADELELAKSKVCSQLVRRAERPTNRMFLLGNSWLQRREYVTVQEAVQRYRDVTVDDIRSVLEQYPLQPNAMVLAGPLTGPS